MGSSSPRDAPRLGGSLPARAISALAASAPTAGLHVRVGRPLQHPLVALRPGCGRVVGRRLARVVAPTTARRPTLESATHRRHRGRRRAARAMPTPRVFRPSRDDRRGGCLRFARGGEVNAIYVTFLLHRRRGHKWNRTRSNHARDDHKGYPLAVCIFDYGPFPPSRSRGPTSSLCSPSANARINPAFPMRRAPFVAERLAVARERTHIDHHVDSYFLRGSRGGCSGVGARPVASRGAVAAVPVRTQSRSVGFVGSEQGRRGLALRAPLARGARRARFRGCRPGYQ